MSGRSFRRPIGAQADVKELEYIVALHQTCLPACRDDVTVSSVDIQRFLKSRLGVLANHTHCLRIVRGLSGGALSQKAAQEICRIAFQQQKTEEEEEEAHGVNADRTDADDAKEKLSGRLLQQSVGLLKKPVQIFRPDKDDGQGIDSPKKGGTQDNEAEAEENDVGDQGEQLERLSAEEEEEPEEYLDIVQLMAALLIPTLARAGKEWRERQESPQRHCVDVDQGADGRDGPGGTQERCTVAEEPTAADETLRPKPTSLIPDGLAILLRTVQGHADVATEYPRVTPFIVKTLLEANGEHERAADHVLVEKMVKAASSASGLLDEEAFVNAVASDISQYPVGSEDLVTSGFFDVFGFESRLEMEDIQKEEQEQEPKEEETTATAYKKKSGSDLVVEAMEHDIENSASEHEGTMESPSPAEEGASSAELSEPYKLKMARIWSPIDFAVDAHSSVALMVGIWVFCIATTIIYATLFQQMSGLQPSCNKDKFGCQVAGTVRTWVTFAVIFVLTGYIIIIPLSVGNSPRRRSPRSTFLSICFCVIYTWIPYVAVRHYEKVGFKPKEHSTRALNNRNFKQAQWLVGAIGILLFVLYLVQFALSLIGNRRIRSSKFLNKWFVSASIRGFARTKKAATRKINSMLVNAHRLHSVVSGTSAVSSRKRLLLKQSAADETMTNYSLHGESFEDCGGLFWTWKMVLSGGLFDTEGIWITSRLFVLQFAQLVVFLFLTFSAFRFVEFVANAADEATAELEKYDMLPVWVYDIVPTGKQAKGALYPAACVAVMVMLILMSIYMPSYVGKTLRYRSGVIPSLRSPHFTMYRKTVDLTYGNIGNAMYGLMGAAFLFWGLTALAVFLIVWPFSRGFMLLVIAWGIGLAITIILKMVMTKMCRAHFYTGFYRERPGAANLSTLALECWFIGLGGGVLVGRFTQFILAACFWVGRTDAPFLSQDVNLAGYAFDTVPLNFAKDILVHDAHHHPYLERLLTMYLLKLKNDKFCSDAGACWRQLFVVSFMPWLIKYRVFSDKGLDKAKKSYKSRSLELEKEESLEKGP